MYAMVIINTVINLLCPWILLNLPVCHESILDIQFNIVIFLFTKVGSYSTGLHQNLHLANFNNLIPACFIKYIFVLTYF